MTTDVLPPRTPSAVSPTRVLVLAGSTCVVAGGLIAAITGPLDWRQGSWLAAYLVLVGGVAQFVMGRVPTWFALPVSLRVAWTQVIGWNLGNAVVIAGSLASLPNVVDIGGAILVVILVDMLRDEFRRDSSAPSHRPLKVPLTLWRWAYRALLIVLAVSVPVGLVLAHLRGG